jgi:hypothetical protein
MKKRLKKKWGQCHAAGGEFNECDITGCASCQYLSLNKKEWHEVRRMINHTHKHLTKNREVKVDSHQAFMEAMHQGWLKWIKDKKKREVNEK